MISIRHRRQIALVLSILLGVIADTKADSIYTWGDNGYGQIGNGTSANLQRTPVKVVASGATVVGAGFNHSLAVINGAAYAWGQNEDGELGDATTANHSTPAPVSGLATGVTAVAGGYQSSLALKDGGVYWWGFGPSPAGPFGANSTPIQMSDLSTGVTSIASGAAHSLAVQNGAVYAWGDDSYGQLGNGSFSGYSATPLPISSLSTGVTAVACGADHNLAIQNGTVFAWGWGQAGELGNGANPFIQTTPQPVTGLDSGVTKIAAGYEHSLALRNGNVYSWGADSLGTPVNNVLADHLTPFLVPGLSNIVDVAASFNSSYALSSDGSLWVWGTNTYGELGLGNAPDSFSPTHLLPPSGFRFTSVASGSGSNQVLATVAPVPEPASLSLLALGFIPLNMRRKSRSRHL
ncbi:MAG TPA: hypothetical protein VHS31_05250 [Tepidisphaeraceae bacterium]|nr:hypothetical protein [Tepidisphaeraceae bacterium]